MPELLFELGCEELPATAVRRAYNDLLDSLTGAFREAGILGEPPVQQLQRDLTAELLVLGQIDIGHAAGADA